MANSTVLPGVNTNAGGIPGAAAGNTQPGTLVGTGGTGGFLGELFGQVPGVANPLASARESISGNRGNLQDIANLAYGTDTISAAGAALPFDMNLPGYQNMLNTASTNVQSDLQGQLPQDTVNQIEQLGAERGIATGQAGYSPNTNAAILKDLGLTSLNLQQTGMQGMEGLVGETPQGTQFNPSAEFVTPDQQQAAEQATQNALAAPDPALSGIMSAMAPDVSC